MRTPPSSSHHTPPHGAPRARAQAAFVLLTILILVMLASMVAASLMFSLRAEVTAQAASAGQEQAWAAASSGIARALAIAQSTPPHLSSWSDQPAAFQHQLVADDGVDQWYFSIYAAPRALGTEVRFGLDDEASKLSLDRTDADWLARLPGLDSDHARSLLAAHRETPAPPRAEVAPAEADLSPSPSPPLSELPDDNRPTTEASTSPLPTNEDSTPRTPSAPNSPADAPSVLAEVFARAYLDPALLHGEDSNDNLRLDPQEDDGDALPPTDDLDGILDTGLQSLLTVSSYEPNVDATGKPRVNLNDPEADLDALALPTTTRDYLAALRRAGQSLAHPVDLLEAEASLPDESGKTVTFRSGIGTQQLADLLDRSTATNATYLVGLLNINTAPRAVLAALPGLGEAGADAILASRSGLGPEEARTPAWLLQRGILTPAQFKELAPSLTTRSYQFTVRSLGYALPSGRYRVLTALIDVATQPARILALQDQTRSGFPVPLDLLETSTP